MACIGRSFSDDGGGGHNPVEAVQLGCAVLHGPRVQFQKAFYDELHAAGAALLCNNETALLQNLRKALKTPEALQALRAGGQKFLQDSENILALVMREINPILDRITPLQEHHEVQDTKILVQTARQ